MRIEISNEKGTGFFLKTNINDNSMKFSITCSHIISNDLINSKKKLIFFFGKKKKKKKEILL